ncbi:MAG: hypothetical protein IPP42_01050 [Saprospiraceae bacterium]|nr:hypothetical protein [Saprospiraceae bacterium]
MRGLYLAGVIIGGLRTNKWLSKYQGSGKNNRPYPVEKITFFGAFKITPPRIFAFLTAKNMELSQSSVVMDYS